MRRAAHEVMNKTRADEFRPIQHREAVLLTEGLLQMPKEWDIEFRRRVYLFHRYPEGFVNVSIQSVGIYDTFYHIRPPNHPINRSSHSQGRQQIPRFTRQLCESRELSR